MMDLKRVDRIHQKYKDIVNHFIKDVETLLPRNNTYYTIPDLINHMILLYYHMIFESNLLDYEDREKLLNLLNNNDKEIVNYSWKLIFDSAKDGFGEESILNKMNCKQNIFLLIKLKGDIIIGGYTRTGWNASTTKPRTATGARSDKDAFVFYLKSPRNYQPFISNVRQDEKSSFKALGYGNSSYYGLFGDKWIFYFSVQLMDMNALGLQYHHGSEEDGNYEEFSHGQNFLSGEDVYWYTTDEFDMEVFQIEIEQ